MSDSPILDDAETGRGVLEEAFFVYRDLGLRLPPMPRELVGALRALSSTSYGTEPVDLFAVPDFQARATNPATAPLVAFGPLGHGIASWWLCYQLITDALALFIRVAFGGTESSDQAAANAVNQVLGQAEELIVFADATRAAGKLPAGRAIVVHDHLEQGFMALAGPASATPSDNAVAEALAALTAGARS